MGVRGWGEGGALAHPASGSEIILDLLYIIPADAPGSKYTRVSGLTGRLPTVPRLHGRLSLRLPPANAAVLRLPAAGDDAQTSHCRHPRRMIPDDA